jgi:hypothetical protein
LELPLASLIGLTDKRKKLLTYTQETTRVKLERLCSVRLIHGDQKTTTRHAMALRKAKGLISLLSHPGSKKRKLKPLYVCPGCSNHTYSNNMVNRYNISINYRVKSYKMTRGSKRKIIE